MLSEIILLLAIVIVVGIELAGLLKSG